MMAKDIYLIMKQCAVLSPKSSRGGAGRSSSEQLKGESEKQREGGSQRDKVDSLAQPAEEPVQAL
jgi:hypothetical protein